MNIPDLKSSLVSDSFKGELTKFYTLYISRILLQIYWQDTTCMSGGINEKTMKVSNDVVHIIEQLWSNHEKAATLILLHVADQARQGPKRVIVVSPDTDVLVFLVHHFSCMRLCEIVFKTGIKSTHADLTRFIHIKK